jgi:phosphotransacetylase
MDPPALKAMSMAQLIVKDMLRQMIRYQIRQKIAVGEIKAEIEDRQGNIVSSLDAFKIISPELSPKDLLKLGGALSQITTSLMIAQQQRWITRETAANVFANAATALGMEVEAADISEIDGTAQVTEDYSRESARPARKAYA